MKISNLPLNFGGIVWDGTKNLATGENEKIKITEKEISRNLKIGRKKTKTFQLKNGEIIIRWVD